MRLKNQTVNVRAIRKEFWAKLFVLDLFWRQELGYELVITSANDATHAEHSKHYIGEAVDIRTWTSEKSGKQLDPARRAYILFNAMKLMGNDFRILDEDDHFHIEYIGA